MIDGAKGLRKAVSQVFGPAGVGQRCQGHTRETVVASSPTGQPPAFRRKLRVAYAQPTYAGGKAALGRLAKALQLANLSAVESLQEGLEETLTLHRLGLAGAPGAAGHRTPAPPDQGASPPAPAPAGPRRGGEGHDFSNRSAGRCLTNPGELLRNVN